MKSDRTGEKATRFERLAVRRVTETIKKMRLIGNLANRHNYSYNEDHVNGPCGQTVRASASMKMGARGRILHIVGERTEADRWNGVQEPGLLMWPDTTHLVRTTQCRLGR